MLLNGTIGTTDRPLYVCQAVISQLFIEVGCNIGDVNVDCGDDQMDITLATMSMDAAFGGVSLVCFACQ